MRLMLATLGAGATLAVSGCTAQAAQSVLIGSWSCLADVKGMHVDMKATYSADKKSVLSVKARIRDQGKVVTAAVDMHADWRMSGDMLVQKVTDMQVKSLAANGDRVDPEKGQEIFDSWVGTFADLQVIDLKADHMTLKTKEAPADCKRVAATA